MESKVVARSEYPDGDLAAVCNKDFGKIAFCHMISTFLSERKYDMEIIGISHIKHGRRPQTTVLRIYIINIWGVLNKIIATLLLICNIFYSKLQISAVST